MNPMDAALRGRRGSGLVWPLTAAMLVGVAAGMALPRPHELARAAQQPPTVQQPLPFPGAQPPPGENATDADAAADEADTEPAPPVATRTFEAPAAMVINFVQAGSTSSFETVMRRLIQSLDASEDPERRAQAAGWTMYRVREPGPNNNVTYVWLLNPAVAGANYAVPQLLNESLPEEVQQLYETYNQSFGVGQAPLNLDPVVLLPESR